MRRAAAPIYEMIKRWVFDGKLEDLHSEFFVACDPTAVEQRWQERYRLSPDMLPTFVPLELARQIVLIGKSINFVRECCDGGGEREDRSAAKSGGDGGDSAEGLQAHAATAHAHAAAFTYDASVSPTAKGRLAHVIKELSVVMNERLVKILLHQYKLLDHCEAMKKFLMLGQGDFIEYLMDLLGEELCKPAKQIHRHNLVGVLETALRGSNAQHIPQHILERLDVRLLEPSAGDAGWDTFSLDYKLTSPLDIVVTNASVQQYLRIFNFLWRLKRVDYTLSSTWQRYAQSIHTSPHLPTPPHTSPHLPTPPHTSAIPPHTSPHFRHTS
jgi:gamma-tubulin complex component 3